MPFPKIKRIQVLILFPLFKNIFPYGKPQKMPSRVLLQSIIILFVNKTILKKKNTILEKISTKISSKRNSFSVMSWKSNWKSFWLRREKEGSRRTKKNKTHKINKFMCISVIFFENFFLIILLFFSSVFPSAKVNNKYYYRMTNSSSGKLRKSSQKHGSVGGRKSAEGFVVLK